MKKLVFSPFLSASLVTLPLVFASAAIAQNAAKPRTIYLYNASLGRAPASINAAKSGPWGNGSISNTRRVDYEGAPVLQITTRNLQEGARFDFTNPVDISAYQDSGFLRLRLRFRDAGGFGGGGFPGGPGGFPGGGFPGGGFPGGGGRGGRGGGGRFGGPGGNAQAQIKPHWTGNAQFRGPLPPIGGGGPGGFPGRPGGFPGGPGGPGGFPGGGFPGGPGGEGGEGGAPAVAQQFTSIKEIAVTLLRENGATVGRIPIDLNAQAADEEGWRLYVLPIKNLTSTPGASGKVTRAIFTSDVEDTFYMAQAALVIESGDMTVSIRRPDDAPGAGPAEIEVKPGGLSLIADVEAGAADPIVEWNFDADNVGNLPPGALNTPAIPQQGGEGDMGGGMAPGTPGVGDRGGMPGGMAGGFPGGPPGGMPGMGGLAIDGPRLDARGLTATFDYPNEEQNYRVEVTVRDRSGVKPPVKTSILVKVRG